MAHSLGQETLLSLREPDQLYTEEGKAMLRLVCARRFARSLVTSGKPILTDMENPMLFSCTGPVLYKLSQAMSVSSDIYQLYSQAMQDQTLRLTLLSLLHKAYLTDQELRGVLITIEDDLKYTTIETPVCKRQSDFNYFVPYCSSSYILNDITKATFWNMHWCTRIRLHQAILKCLPLVIAENPTITLPNELTLRTVVCELVNSVCALGPYILGKLDNRGILHPTAKGKCFGAFQYIWCLFVAGSVEYIPLAQFEWIRLQLLYIGNIIGIRHALALHSELGILRNVTKESSESLSACLDN